jgi:hypothetical protein
MMVVYTLWILVALLAMGAGTARDAHVSVVEERRALDMAELRAAAISGLEAYQAVLAEYGNRQFSHPGESYRTERELCDFEVSEGMRVLCYHTSHVPGRGLQGPQMHLGADDEESRINLFKADPKTLARVPGVNERMAEDLRHYLQMNPSAIIRGPEDLATVPGWQNVDFGSIAHLVTFYGSGKVNVNTASSQVLELLGVSRRATGEMHRYLAGPNGVRGDEDDRHFAAVNDIVPALRDFGVGAGVLREWMRLT